MAASIPACRTKLDGEFALLDDDHYILLSYYLKQPTNIPDSLHPASGVTVVDNALSGNRQQQRSGMAMGSISAC